MRVAAGSDEGVGGQDQPQYAGKGNVGGHADGLCEGVKAEAGSKQIKQADQCNDTEEVLTAIRSCRSQRNNERVICFFRE